MTWTLIALLVLMVCALVVMCVGYIVHRSLHGDFAAWHVDEAPSEAVAFALKAVALVAGIAALLIGLHLCAMPARAHDEAAWIQNNVGAPEGGYLDRNGVHCCGPEHCYPAQAGEVMRVPGGWLHVPTGTLIRDGEKGIYPSQEAVPFRCVWGGELKCFFPATGA